MYRGQDFANREELVQNCLRVMKGGKKKDLYDILPFISVIRSPSFYDPLLQLLRSRQRDHQEFAALGLGSLGNPDAIDPLFETFVNLTGGGRAAPESLQIALILALGEIGDERAIEPLLKIFEQDAQDKVLASRRRTWVLSALGNLAQQGTILAVKELTQVMRSREPELRAQAISELTVAYWHRVGELPETVLQQIVSLTADQADEVRRMALASLKDLAHLGCRAAEQHLERKS